MLILCAGCNVARLTRLIHSATPPVASQGEPSVLPGGWGKPPADGRGFAVYSHQPAPDPQHCTEFNVEPAAETDDSGHLCESFVP